MQTIEYLLQNGQTYLRSRSIGHNIIKIAISTGDRRHKGMAVESQPVRQPPTGLIQHNFKCTVSYTSHNKVSICCAQTIADCYTIFLNC
jgi:hypothetical protein